MEKTSSITETNIYDVPEIHSTEAYIDPVIEKRALRKFDIFLLPVILLLVIIASLDRSNLGNAHIIGFDISIGLVGTQFNNISTVFFPTYIIFEVPWVVAVKRFGINRVLFMAMLGWSIVTLGTGFVHNYSQAIVVRVLLGIFEAALLPCIVFIVSTVWGQNSQAKRVSTIYVAGAISGGFGGLIAYGIDTMGKRANLAPWQWLFVIEGIISAGVCSTIWAVMPHSAEKAWFLKEDEKMTMRARRERDSLYKGDNNFSWTAVRMALMDPLVWLGALAIFANSTALLGFGVFLPTIIAGLGYTSLQANYLTLPVYLFAGVMVFTVSWISDRVHGRAKILAVVTFPTIFGYAMIIGSSNKVAGYIAMFLCGSGMFCFNSVMLTWVSINLAPDYKRSVGIPVMLACGNTSGILASQIYPPADRPRYIQGNAVSMGMEVLALCITMAMVFLLKFRNGKKAKMIAQGATENGKTGDGALNFTYLL